MVNVVMAFLLCLTVMVIAEWEYAARGGLIGKEYSWGNDESLARNYANYQGTGGKDK